MFGLGGQEILLLAMLGIIPLVVVVIVLANQKKRRGEDSRDRREW